MAAENERVLRKRKRKIDYYGTKLKLDVDQKVEVRSLEDGFLGSWHSGTVIGCDDLIRQVKYDHLLSDVGSGNLVEYVSVSPMVDGLITAADQKPVHHRGLLRPLPPPREFSRWPLPHGQCVDLFYQDAWWEGVIFDREHDAEERTIFFPDMGDEMKAQVDKLRITQDWDEVTEEWEPRGSWMFLEVIEEIEKLHPLLVSVKQIWYEVQLKKDYENLKEWTSPLRDVWRNLVIEVVLDNTKLTVKQFLSELNSSQDFVEGGQLLEFSEVAFEAKLNLKTYFDNLTAPSAEAVHRQDSGGTLAMEQDVSILQPVEKHFVSEGLAPTKEDGQLCGNCVCRTISPSQKEEPSVSPHAFSVLPPPTEDIAGILSSSKREALAFTKCKPRRGRPPTKRKFEFLKFKPRRGRPPTKKRFEGQTSIDEADFCPDAITKRRLEFVKCKPRRGRPPTKKRFEEQTPINEPDVCPDAIGKRRFEFVKCKPRRGRPPTKKRFEEQTPTDEPDSCPDAISKHIPSMSSKKNFKKHLLYLGWKFELMMDCGIIKKRYIAPNGKVCLSLHQVCQVLEESKASGLDLPVDQTSLYKSPDNSIQSPCMARPQTCREEPELPSHSVEAIVDPSIEARTNTCREEPDLSSPSEEAIVDPEASEEAIVDPEICPQAVIDYCSPGSRDAAYQNNYKQGMRVGDTSLKAKKHLAAIGWTIYSVGKKGQRLRFCSPEGESFNSLRKACRWCAQKWEAESYLPEQGSSPSSAMQFQSNSSPAKDSSEKSPVELSHISLLREPLKHGKAKFRHMTKPRKRRKHGDERDINEGELPLSKGKKHRASLQEGHNIVPHSSTCDMRSSKRARQPDPSSSQKKPRTVLSWLIDNKVVLPHVKVQFCGKKYGNPMAEGRITRKGIKCYCCQNIYGLRNFAAHAGSSCPTPSANIFLEDGRSLLECQLQMKQKKSVKRNRKEPRALKMGSQFSTNDYICSVCHEGGTLVLCDECPSSFHPGCLGMKVVPDGDWFCPSCCCKVCGESGFNTNRNHFTDNSVLSCYQCEHKYHARCMRSKDHGKLDKYPEGNWFCNKRCELIFLGMRHLLGKPVTVGSDKLTWTLLKYIEPDESGSDIVDNESSVENFSRLIVALDVMHECFEPVKERHTRRDLVEDVIFSRWSELNRLNFQGFYTVLLERNDELITVAAVRVYGEKVAEIPLVATRFQHRRLGMCRILMNELEKVHRKTMPELRWSLWDQTLMEFGVERLVLPAVPDVLNTWTTSFGFSVMKESERVNFLDYTFLDFQGTVMCQKILQKIPSVVSSALTESQQTHVDNTNSEDNADLDGNAAVSEEVFQAKQVEGCATVDQGSVETSAINGDDFIINFVDSCGSLLNHQSW